MWERFQFLIVCILIVFGMSRLTAQNTDPLSVTFGETPQAQVLVGQTIPLSIQLTGSVESCPVIPNAESVDAVLLIDTSSSMDSSGTDLSPIDAVKEAAIAFVDQMSLDVPIEEGGDQVAIVQFNTDSRIVSPLIQDVDTLRREISALEAEGVTNMAAGLDEAIDVLADPLRQNPGANRVIVLLSDGDPDDLDLVRRRAATAQAAGARIITIGLGINYVRDFLIEIASSPDDFYEVRNLNELSQVYQNVAELIQPRTAAQNIQLNFTYNTNFFELIDSSISPAPSARSPGSISWTLANIIGGERREVTLRLRATTLAPPGSLIRIGQIENTVYEACENREDVRSLDLLGPAISIIPPSPTPLPTFTNTPRPTATPTITPTPTPPAIYSNPYTLAPERQVSLLGALEWCTPGWWWLWTPFILGLLIFFMVALTFFNRWRKRPPSIACILTRLFLAIWLLVIVLPLFTLPFLSQVCPAQEHIYFLRQDSATNSSGLYSTVPVAGDLSAFTRINQRGLPLFHTVTTANTAPLRIAVVQAVPPGPLRVYDDAGNPLTTIPPISAVSASFSPDGTQMVVADERADLQIIDLANGTSTPLLGASSAGIAETMPTWGPNDEIFFVGTERLDRVYYGGAIIETPTRLYRIPASGGTPRELAGIPQGFNYDVAISPDGRWLAYVHHQNRTTFQDEAAEIRLIEANGNATSIRLRANDAASGNVILGAGNSQPAWRSDSRALAFTSLRDDPQGDIFYTLLQETGDSGEARPVRSASIAGIFEINPSWGQRNDANYALIPALLPLLPLFLPILPLLLLGYAFCAPGKPIPSKLPRPPKPNVAPPPKPDFLPSATNIPLWKPQPTLVIGLGEAGRWTLTHLKKNILDAGLGKAEPSVRLLCLDTGSSAHYNLDFEPIEVAGVGLDTDEIVELTDSLYALTNKDLSDDPQFRKWWKDAAGKLRSAGRAATDLNQGGAQGQRVLARAGLLVHLRTHEHNFFTRLRDIIPACVSADSTLNVVIVADLSSDIGSSALFDVALLTKAAAQQSEQGTERIRITAHLLTDNVVRHHVDNLLLRQINTAAALREITRFQLAHALPFPIHYEQIADTQLTEIPLDDVVLYDGSNIAPPVDPRFNVVTAPPEQGIYPAIADNITLMMEARVRAALRELLNAQFEITQRRQNIETNVHLANQGIYSLRVPFADIAMELTARLSEGSLLYLLLGSRANDVAALQSAASRADLSQDVQYLLTDEQNVTPQVLAKAFFTGSFALVSEPLIRGEIFELLASRDEDSEEIVEMRRQTSRSIREDSYTSNFEARLQVALLVILNGSLRAITTENYRLARGGKLSFALAFLQAVDGYLSDYVPWLRDIKMNFLADSLKDLAEPIARLQANLRLQAALIGLPGLHEDDLPEPLLNRARSQRQRYDPSKQQQGQEAPLSPYEEQLRRIVTRRYLFHEIDEERGKTRWSDVWYAKYSDELYETIMKQIFWNLNDEGQLVLSVRLGENTETHLDEQQPEAFAEALQDLIRFYVLKLREAEREPFSKVLLSDAFSDLDLQFDATVTDLVDRSRLTLNYAPEKAPELQERYILAMEPETPRRTDLIQRVASAHSRDIFDIQTDMPYTITLVRRAAVIPLAAVKTLEETWATYRLNHNLSNQPGVIPPSDIVPSAAFEAEAVALQLEQGLVTRLRQRKDLLHPVVITALTASQRAEVFCMAVASGEIEINQSFDGSRTITIEVPSLDLRIRPSTILEQIKLPDLATGLLAFINDEEVINLGVIQTLSRRYRDTPQLIKIWQNFVDGTWQLWLQDLDQQSRRNQLIEQDVLKLARLFASDYIERLS